MASGLLAIVGSDLRLSGGPGPETRLRLAEALPNLEDWAQRYDRAATQDDSAALLAIGREIFAWLDQAGWASAWARAAGDRELEVRVEGIDDAAEVALLEAPWELLAEERDPLTLDPLQPFVVWRRVGAETAPPEAEAGNFKVMFMAAAPEGQALLDYEQEEARILEATRANKRVHLVVEETGALEPLRDRLSSEEGPFEVLHLTCHGTIDPTAGPVLIFETAEGGEHPVDPGDLIRAYGAKRPALVVVSACRTAEGEKTASFVRSLVRGTANVVGWDGSVYDRDATDFAGSLYEALGRGFGVPQAAAFARRDLLRASLDSQSGGRGNHWHLARVYLGAAGGGPLCATNRPPRPQPKPVRAFLDTARGRIQVAPREAFVGRRRTIQRVVRTFREEGTAVLIHGMGALGKSSLAARVETRMPHRTLVLFERYDTLTVFDTLVEALPPQERGEARKTWRARVEADESCLVDALEEWLTGPFSAAPILLIVDDLEQVLETPQPGEIKTRVGERHRQAIAAILRAFEKAASNSHLLITSRYDFQLADGMGDCAQSLTRVHLQPMAPQEQRKQLRAAARVAGQEKAESDRAAEALVQRALDAAGGNPGLQEVLSRPILAGELTAAEEALDQLDHFRANGAPPEAIQELLDEGTAKDSENALVAFFARVSLQTYRDSLTADEARQLSAATLFAEGVPIPCAALAATAQALGLEAPEPAIARLLGLGLFDDWGTIDGHSHAAANALAYPLAPPLDPADRPRLAARAFPELTAAWQAEEGNFPLDQRGVVAAEVALEGGVTGKLLNAAARAGASHLYNNRHDVKGALSLSSSAISSQNEAGDEPSAGLIFTAIDSAQRLGEMELLTEILEAGVRSLQKRDPDWGSLLLRMADLAQHAGRYDDALGHARESAAIFDAFEQPREAAIAASKIADILQKRGDTEEALRIRCEEELPVFERLGDVRERAITMGRIADILQKRGDTEEALRIRRKEELPVYERLGDVRSRAVTMGQIADILQKRGDTEEALRIRCEEELPVFERLGDVRERAITMGRIADILQKRGDTEEALRIRREEQLPVYERLGDVRERAVTMGKIADILQQRGDTEEALRIRREEELPVYERLGDVRERAITMGQIADILQKRGEIEEALRIRREEQLPVFERLGDVRERAVTMGKIADILQQRGDTEQALRIRREEELPVYERLGDVRERSVALQKLADTLVQLGALQDERAQEVFETLAESYAIARRLKLADGMAYVGWQLAQIMAGGGLRKEVLTLLDEVEEAFTVLKDAEGIAKVRDLRQEIEDQDAGDAS